jgi:L-ascorbate metabolism protein UlaG (beta-lactamase superfamily)
VRLVNAVHSSVLPDGSFAGAAAGFVIKSEELSFYYAGDTGLTYDMKLIGDYYKVDLAFLPIGDNYTMDIDDAIIASDFIKCRRIIGMHYNTWPIIGIDTKEAVNKFSKAGKELILFNISETKLL